MSMFVNVWPSDWSKGWPAHQCVSCGEIVYGLVGMREHVCKEEKTATEAQDTSLEDSDSP